MSSGGGSSGAHNSSGARAWTAAVVPPKSAALDDAARRLSASLTSGGTVTRRPAGAAVLRSPWTGRKPSVPTSSSSSALTTIAGVPIAYATTGAVIVGGVALLALLRRWGSSAAASTSSSKAGAKRVGKEEAIEDESAGERVVSDGEPVEPARALHSRPPQDSEEVWTGDRDRRSAAPSPERVGAASSVATSDRWMSPALNDGSVVEQDVPVEAMSEAEAKREVARLRRALQQSRSDHAIELDMMHRDTSGAVQALLRQQRAVVSLVERVEGAPVDETELTYNALEESNMSLGSASFSDVTILDNVTFDRLLLRIASSGVDVSESSPSNGGLVILDGSTSSLPGRDGDRQDEIDALRSQVERLAALNTLLQQRLAATQRELRDSQALLGDVGADSSVDGDKLRSNMDATTALLKGEVIALDWPGLERVTGILGEMRSRERKTHIGQAGGQYLEAFEDSFDFLKETLKHSNSEATTAVTAGERWTISDLEGVLDGMTHKIHKKLFVALQEMVVAYDALPNGTRNHLDSAREVVLNCHTLLELARNVRWKLTSHKAERLTRSAERKSKTSASHVPPRPGGSGSARPRRLKHPGAVGK